MVGTGLWYGQVHDRDRFVVGLVYDRDRLFVGSG